MIHYAENRLLQTDEGQGNAASSENGQFLKLIMSVGEWQERRKQRAKLYAKLYH